jgi:pimeloyl-ACP methyl ester carboxylesterase
LLVFAGGPGQGARDFADVADRYFRPIRRTRDVVLIDMRGTGASHRLTCPVPDDELAALSEPGGLDAARCARALDADPRAYTHAESLADVDAVRARLGYDRLNLWGGSWGTRAALLYALRYGEHVRSVVLDGAVPLTMDFPRSASSDAQRALELLAGDCRAEATCAERYPDPVGILRTLASRLDQGPLTGRINHPRTGAPVDVTLSKEAVLETLRTALYVPQDAAAVFFIAHRAAEGDLRPLVAQALRTASVSVDQMAMGATMAVLCSEDLPVTQTADFAADAAGSVFGTGYADVWRARCRTWPAGPAFDADRGVSTTVPALILSGTHDPVTPPAWGEAMGRHFPHHHHLEVPAAAHNASFTGCVPDVVAAFIARGGTDDLDATCVQRAVWPRVVLGPEGPRP